MAMHQLETFYASPVFGFPGFLGLSLNGISLMYEALDAGSISSTSKSAIVVKVDGIRVVFKGTFKLDDSGNVVGGKMTDFVVKIGETKIMEGSHYKTKGADLYQAILEFPMDDEAMGQLLFDHALKQKGSKYDDTLFDITVMDSGAPRHNDVFEGKGGSDWIYSGKGDDILRGGNGNDMLLDYAGINKMYGGKGADTFAFALYADGSMPFSIGKIMDFKPGEDSIGIMSNAPGLRMPGMLKNKYFRKGTEAKDGTDHIIYHQKSGKIYFDPDGAGGEAQVKFAKVDDGLKLKAHDFFIMLDVV